MYYYWNSDSTIGGTIGVLLCTTIGTPIALSEALQEFPQFEEVPIAHFWDTFFGGVFSQQWGHLHVESEYGVKAGWMQLEPI